MLQTSLLKSLNKTETLIFYPQCVLCLQRHLYSSCVYCIYPQYSAILTHYYTLIRTGSFYYRGIAGMAKRGNPTLKPRNVASEQCLPCLLWLVSPNTYGKYSKLCVSPYHWVRGSILVIT